MIPTIFICMSRIFDCPPRTAGSRRFSFAPQRQMTSEDLNDASRVKFLTHSEPQRQMTSEDLNDASRVKFLTHSEPQRQMVLLDMCH